MVDDSGSVSTWLNTLSGVSQVRVQGPLLIYINDLPSVLRYCKHIIFVDQTQIWSNCNGLKLNELKRKVMIDNR